MKARHLTSRDRDLAETLAHDDAEAYAARKVDELRQRLLRAWKPARKQDMIPAGERRAACMKKDCDGSGDTSLHHEEKLQTFAPTEERMAALAPTGGGAALSSSVIALDPGVRTFMTGFTELGEVYHWGHGDIQRLYRMGKHLDALISKRTRKLTCAHAKCRYLYRLKQYECRQTYYSKVKSGEIERQKNAKPLNPPVPPVRCNCATKVVNHRVRWRMGRAISRMRRRMRYLVDDLHRRLCRWLCETFEVIVLPKFETSGMVKRWQRRLHSKTVRQMLTWSHYRFRQRLLDKVRQYPGVEVHLVSEEYTSKTCSWCGTIHWKLGGSKVFRCPRPGCGLTLDRDVNGARNIFLKFLTELGCYFMTPALVRRDAPWLVDVSMPSV